MNQKFNGLITRRGFLKAGIFGLIGTFANFLIKDKKTWKFLSLQTKRIYIANDDHTDYMWSANEDTCQRAFIEMIDYYLNLTDQTKTKLSEYQSRFNLDGSFWVWTYEKNKSSAEFTRLISRIRDGHITMPLNPLNLLYGAMPTEAVIRSMYYAGKLERRFNLRFLLAASLENQTLPYGISALWSGSGARYSWKGVCGCATKVRNLQNRDHDIYWYTGPDGSRILMKWHSLLGGSAGIGGYAEARETSKVIDYVDTNTNFIEHFPYQVIGIFGKGWDDLKILTNEFVKIAEAKTNSRRKVIVSNEVDFFQDFETTYGSTLPAVSESYGNEWDILTASLSELSARVRRANQKLRSAEALATMVSDSDPTFMDGRNSARDTAWLNMGLYYEHDWTADGRISRGNRQDWEERLTEEIESYVDNLQNDSIQSLGGLIVKSSENPSFFVFNPLGWVRTDYADFRYDDSTPVHVIDTTTGKETPSQLIEIDGSQWLRILAQNVPPVGYKVYEIMPDSSADYTSAAILNNAALENKYYRLQVANRGAITSLVGKSQGEREFVQQINGRVINDLGSGSGVLEVINSGPVSRTIRAKSDSPLRHITSITLFNDINRVEIRNEINQNFNSVFTWGFGFELENPAVWHEEVGAIALAKLTNQGGHYALHNARYDWLTLNHFVDINDGSQGVTISSSDCSFMRLGNSSTTLLDTDTPLISVLAGGQVDGSNLGIVGQGGYSYFLQRFALRSHNQFNPAEAMKFSLEHQNPLITGEISGGNKWPAKSGFSLTIDNPNVLLWAFKPAEDGVDKGIVARVWNISSEKSNFKLGVPYRPIQKVMNMSHIETPNGYASLSGGKLIGSLKPWQMRTYLIKLSDNQFPGLLPMDGFENSQ